MPERATGAAAYDENIFLNCPFDDAYKPIFEALVFAAFDCGYVPRCALEADDERSHGREASTCGSLFRSPFIATGVGDASPEDSLSRARRERA